MRNNFPDYRGNMEYYCLGCDQRYGIDELLYTCPSCGGVLMLHDAAFASLKAKSGEEWRALFDTRAASKLDALRGIFRFYEIMAPVLEPEDIIYLGEGNTPVINASPTLREAIGANFAIKNDGQNPSASFKDRGMACAFSYLRALIRKHGWDEVLTICASTGDTSAAAALYAAYVGGPVKSVVLLPQGKVTPQQLGQPLGSGATVIELPGVFDDCMKVVEDLARNYRVALLNSKNAWRILGQESYAFEAAQWRDWDMRDLCLFVPIGNAGNITAVLNGFLKLHELNIIARLPRIFGVQSSHADPVFRYYEQESAAGTGKAEFKAVKVRPSVAQAAMIGNPVSFPRVRRLVAKYRELAGDRAFQVVRVSEQDIIESMLLANRHGHIVCTQGGESLAGLREALRQKLVGANEFSLIDSTAHMLKFAGFQEHYFADDFAPEYEIKPDGALKNAPLPLFSQAEKDALTETEYVRRASVAVADQLGLKAR
ncbi:MAG: threonine synthase [Deltaproteobacteria bacterium]|jgi:threonine synthase|nr:threonine synthase [Deltaproteobacteria bacterium]